jgi:branched-chain amino acid aminotransferase
MSIEKSEWIWMSGRWVKWDQATVHVTAHALHYGSSAFEGIRAYGSDHGPAIFRLDRHLERLLDSCKLLRFDMGSYDLDSLTQVTLELVARNRQKSCYIRPIAFRGAENMGVYPLTCPVEVAIFSFPWGRYLGPEAIEQGIDAHVSSWRRYAPATTAPLGKIGGQYVPNQFVAVEARQNGFAEGIMLDSFGFVSEGGGENLFLVKRGEIVTTPLSSSILEGVTRDSVITLARDLGYVVREQNVTREMLYLCDELFMTGTAAEITPVRSVDRIQVGSGKRGPITKRMQEEFFGMVEGSIPDRHGWLTRVPQLAPVGADR